MTHARQVISRASVGQSKRQSGAFNVDGEFTSVLVFDTETETDFTQAGRIGAFQIKDVASGAITDAGLFVFPSLTPDEFATVNAYGEGFASRFLGIVAQDRDAARVAGHPDPVAAYRPMYEYVRRTGRLNVIDARAFALLMLGHLQNGGAVIGHNVPFDLARVASAAWGHDDTTYGQGFAYAMCDCSDRRITSELVPGAGRRVPQIVTECPRHPHIISRNLGGKKRQYGLSHGAYSGPIIDTVILGKAILGPGNASLRSLGERAQCSVLKRTGEDGHGDALRPEYLDYLIVDVAASLDLFSHLWIKYLNHGLSQSVSLMFSEASLGKAYFNELGVTSHIRRRPFYLGDTWEAIRSQSVLDIAQASYQGARSEVRLRLTPAPVLKADFKSQYPTVQALMRLQELWTGEAFSVHQGSDVATRASDILQQANHTWLQDTSNWRRLRIIVCIDPNGCILPAKWDDGTSRKPYGMVRHAVPRSADGSPSLTRWVPLSDAVASKLLTGGHMPRIIDAIEITPRGVIPTRPLAMFGRPDMVIDLHKDDLFVKLIEERTRVKAEIKVLKRDAKANYLKLQELNAYELAIKICANATSYGVMAETRIESGREVSGQYYAPFIATHITGGARLLLAIAETLARDIGTIDLGTPIRHCFADTDSLAFVRPDGIATEPFRKVIDKVTGYFQALSPYENDKNLFALETDYIGADGVGWFFGVSCKRYCIYTRDAQGIKILGLSSHGLGPFMYDNGLTCSVDAPDVDSVAIDCEDEGDESDDTDVADDIDPARHKGRQWQAYLWVRAIERSEGNRKPDASERRYHAGFPQEPFNANATRLRVTIATPRQLAQYASLGVLPGSFFLTMPKRPGSQITVAAPFAHSEADILTSDCKDVYTGQVLDKAVVLKSITPMRETLAEYFVNPERKAMGEGLGIEQKPGWLEVPTVTFDGIALRNRRGQAVTGDLFDVSDED